MSAAEKTIAIFGATGGTGLATLKLCLSAGHTVSVLVRAPSKLSTLASQYPNLHLIEGSIHSSAAIKSTLISPSSPSVVDIIISSLGMVLTRSGLSFGSENPNICYEGTHAILSSLYELERTQEVAFPERGPRIVLLSTTGIDDLGRDIPLPMVPLYHWMLGVPHEDKKRMEELMVRGEGSTRRWVLVRPSFLVDGEALGREKVRVSTDKLGEEREVREKERDVAVGYTIRRADVAGWIFGECVDNEEGESWEGRAVTLTY